jgi:hypothetical protein
MDFEMRISFRHRFQFLLVGGHVLSIRVNERDAQPFLFVLRLLEDGAERRDADAAGDEDILFLRVARDEVAVEVGYFIVSPGLSALRVFLKVLPCLAAKRVVSITWRS